MQKFNRSPKECLDLSQAYFHLFTKTGHLPYYDMYWSYKFQATKDLMVQARKLN